MVNVSDAGSPPRRRERGGCAEITRCLCPELTRLPRVYSPYSIQNTEAKTMSDQSFDHATAVKLLNQIMEAELAGVVRYTHYSLMVFGHNRIPIVSWLRSEATTCLGHATQAGELVTQLVSTPHSRLVRYWKHINTASTISSSNHLTRERRPRAL